MKPLVIAALLLGSTLAAKPQPAASLTSPDGQISVSFIAPSARDQSPGFEIRTQQRHRLSGHLGLSLSGTNLLAGAQLKGSQTQAADSTYSVLFGKSNPVRDQFNELALDVETSQGPVRGAKIVFRAYNDGVVFRYLIPAQDKLQSIEITAEPTLLELDGNLRAWPLYRENYTTSHEGLYTETRCANLAINQLIDLPFLTQFEDGFALALTEANLRDYPGMYLRAERYGSGRAVRCDLSPLPGQTRIKASCKLPFASPWRVILMGSQPGRLLESNLILNLNEPSRVTDTSWLKFGKTTWYWWNGPYQEPVDFQVGLNWETMKHYIDFCASNNITFHSIMSTPDEFPWYYQTQRGYGPGPDSDVTRARPGFDMERVAAYARSKEVGLRLWVHWKPLSERLDQAFAQYEKWGIAGLMVDFLDRDDQEMVSWAEKVLDCAVRHHLHIHFHGVWKPTGLQRTYPNLFNHEGVLNLEYLKWSNQCSPPHNVTVPFTRMLAGPMDYHLGGFRSVNRDVFKPINMKPVVLGTRAHHLAMYVVFENPMPMVCDAPTAYEGQPGFDFIREVPTTWDETRVLNGEVGRYIVVARRKGAEWFLGAMTDWTPRVLEVPLNFLREKNCEVETWADVDDSRDPNALRHQQARFTTDQALVLRLNTGGGQVLRIRPGKE